VLTRSIVLVTPLECQFLFSCFRMPRQLKNVLSFYRIFIIPSTEVAGDARACAIVEVHYFLGKLFMISMASEYVVALYACL